MNRLSEWINTRLPLHQAWKRYASEYYLPKNLNIYYVFGFLALVVLLNQLVTGLWLTMFYTPSSKDAFDSIQYIMRDVSYGWLLRYMHSTGASSLFIILYLHLFRGLLYGSYQKPRELVWIGGMVLFVLLMMEACFGYLLPWGQLSFWGAQVMTSVLSAIPFLGNTLTTWLRGDYMVSDATLHRFFALHILGVPLLIGFFVWLHLVCLRQVGSNNPRGVEPPMHEKIPFHPFYTVNDFFSAVVFLILFFAIIFFAPEMGGYFLEPLNALPANPLVTPSTITPLWYMAPFYAMLRATPDKFLGLFVMAAALFVLFTLPWLDKSPVRAMRYKNHHIRIAFILWLVCVIGLGILGTMELTLCRLWLARCCTMFYFAYFVMVAFDKHRVSSSSWRVG
jgi:ubiquinol-cytochrome c reductase cytochrome b subunit